MKEQEHGEYTKKAEKHGIMGMVIQGCYGEKDGRNKGERGRDGISDGFVFRSGVSSGGKGTNKGDDFSRVVGQDGYSPPHLRHILIPKVESVGQSHFQ